MKNIRTHYRFFNLVNYFVHTIIVFCHITLPGFTTFSAPIEYLLQ